MFRYTKAIHQDVASLRQTSPHYTLLAEYREVFDVPRMYTSTDGLVWTNAHDVPAPRPLKQPLSDIVPYTYGDCLSHVRVWHNHISRILEIEIVDTARCVTEWAHTHRGMDSSRCVHVRSPSGPWRSVPCGMLQPGDIVAGYDANSVIIDVPVLNAVDGPFVGTAVVSYLVEIACTSGASPFSKTLRLDATGKLLTTRGMIPAADLIAADSGATYPDTTRVWDDGLSLSVTGVVVSVSVSRDTYTTVCICCPCAAVIHDDVGVGTVWASIVENSGQVETDETPWYDVIKQARDLLPLADLAASETFATDVISPLVIAMDDGLVDDIQAEVQRLSIIVGEYPGVDADNIADVTSSLVGRMQRVSGVCGATSAFVDYYDGHVVQAVSLVDAGPRTVELQGSKTSTPSVATPVQVSYSFVTVYTSLIVRYVDSYNRQLSIRCTPNQRLLTHSDGAYSWTHARYIRVGDLLVCAHGTGFATTTHVSFDSSSLRCLRLDAGEDAGTGVQCNGIFTR